MSGLVWDELQRVWGALQRLEEESGSPVPSYVLEAVGALERAIADMPLVKMPTPKSEPNLSGSYVFPSVDENGVYRFYVPLIKR